LSEFTVPALLSKVTFLQRLDKIQNLANSDRNLHSKKFVKVKKTQLTIDGAMNLSGDLIGSLGAVLPPPSAMPF
jgi:hypothetical protein